MRELLTPPQAQRRRALRTGAVLAAGCAAPVLHAHGAQGAPQVHGAQSAPVRRIVSVGGSLTETVYALGAEAELVGVDTTSIYPPQAAQLPRVGYLRQLSAEGVLSLRPTLVVAAASVGPPAVVRQLQAARLGFELFDTDHRLDGVLAMARRLGGVLGRAEAGGRLAAQIAADAERAQREVAALNARRAPLRVLFVLSHTPNQVQIGGADTAADAVITLAGARNALTGVRGFRPLTPEAAIAAAPDVILVTAQGLQRTGGVDGLLRAPGLAATAAGRARRVAALDALLLLGFGPRLPQAVSGLAQALHAVAPPRG
jgi:iron complex transport system substrate-binding protein